jgi:hypothetical protein
MNMKIQIDEKGNIIFNPSEWFQSLDNDAQRELGSLLWDVAYAEIQRMVLEEYAQPACNDAIHNLRVAFLTHEDAPDLFRLAVKGLMRENRKLKTELQEWKTSALAVYHKAGLSISLLPKHSDIPDITDADVEAYVAEVEARP